MITDQDSAGIVVLISGRGSNMESIHRACENGQIQASIVAVISNRPNAKGLEYARKHGIPAQAVDHKKYPSRIDFDNKLQQVIDDYNPDLILFAGFMRILGETFTSHFAGKMLNIHPSLLPQYTGLHTHERALKNQDKKHGASIHFVTSELDGGPVIMQASLRIKKHHTPETLAADILTLEHQLYPLVVSWFFEDRIQLINNTVHLNNRLLAKPVQMTDT